MSSINPFKYFIVTCAVVDRYLDNPGLGPATTHGLVLLVKIIDVSSRGPKTGPPDLRVELTEFEGTADADKTWFANSNNGSGVGLSMAEAKLGPLSSNRDNR